MRIEEDGRDGQSYVNWVAEKLAGLDGRCSECGAPLSSEICEEAESGDVYDYDTVSFTCSTLPDDEDPDEWGERTHPQTYGDFTFSRRFSRAEYVIVGNVIDKARMN
jgi:hypothetical protein